MKTNFRMIVFLMTMVSANVVYGQTNLLPNGDFSDARGVTGWTPQATGSMAFSNTDADNSISSGSMTLAFNSELYNAESASSTCFAVTPGAPYSFGGQGTLDDEGFGVEDLTKMSCASYSDKNCSTAATDLGQAQCCDQSGQFQSANPVFAPLIQVSGALGLSAQSVQCTATAFIGLNFGGGSGRFDDLFFDSKAPVPALGGYLSGSWYDPTQSGQGFQLEFTAQANTLLATWYTYSPNGSGTTQWVYGQGTYDPTKSSVTIPAVLTSGTSFPPGFVASNVKKTPWGNLTFSFSDCDHMTMEWNSTLPGYGSGTQQLRRLTSIAGLSCP